MDDQPSSGNRWEPTTAEAAVSEQPAAEPPPDDQPQVEPSAAAGRTTQVRVGAATIAVLVVGGTVGFGLAHLVSHDRPGSSVTGTREGLPDDDHGRSIHGPRGTPPGQAPQEGTPDDDSSSNDGLAGGGDDT